MPFETPMDDASEFKKLAGERAAEFVRDGMTIGLGSGSTIYWTILRLGERVADGLKIHAIPTSKKTENLAVENKIPLVTFAYVDQLDLTIDGADEISPSLDLIKGGGGSLLREKLVAAASKRLIIVADESKLVERLGTFPLPIEVVPFAWETTASRIEGLNIEPGLRLENDKAFVTDNGNYILDCKCGPIDRPEELHQKLKALTGVVETGLFVGMADMAVIAGESGVRILNRPEK
jgi:ribose 5-phosphate isomerase A